MSYTPTNWKTGDVIVADKLNKIENGIKSIDDEYIVTNWQNGDIITADKSNKIENSIKSIDDEYIVTNWKNGDIITADKLNKIEQALAKQTSISTYELFPEQEYGMDTTSSPIRMPAIQNVDYERFVEGAEVSLTITVSGQTHVLTGFVEKAIPAEFASSDYEAAMLPLLYGTEETLLVYLEGTSVGGGITMGINPKERSVSESGTDILIEKGLVSLADASVTMSATSTIGKEKPEPISTEISTTLPEGYTSPKLMLGVNGKLDVDWGDGTEHSIVTGTVYGRGQWSGHAYLNAGDYTIKIKPIRATQYMISAAQGETKACLASSTEGTSDDDQIYASSITSVVIGEKVLGVGEYAFALCDNLESVLIPENVEYIYSNAFLNSGLKNITISEAASHLTVSSQAFKGCANLKSIVLPEGVSSIDSNAFQNCTSLENVALPSSLSRIDSNAFQNCTSLENVTLPSNLSSIGKLAFANSGVTDIVIPDSTRIYESAFSGCSNLTHVSLPSEVSTLPTSTFENCTSLVDITIPNNVTTIGSSCFSGCSNLTHISLPSGVSKLSASAFKNCTSLVNIVIPNSVTNFGNFCFSGCSGLTTITIPNSVTTIGASVFNNCTNISSYYVKNSTPPTLNTGLVGTVDFVVYIPTGSREAYTAATMWSNYASKFVEMDM